MKKHIITVYRKLLNKGKVEFMSYEFMNKDLADNALREIITGGCWKNIPQKKKSPPCDVVMKIYLPPHEICEIQYVEREM